ncbi:MerR family transcriptional regulator [Lysinibacillus xylanilyticus]|uniref:helix-turn-helix domain-containing protein n=1 Tax=Lysinibacillus xylanilyticus TaxID=582475 RepID=UPI002B2475E3|nr:MerR family transcriptional regulator [Lysinibacillus xylanilyticus]MEB2282747.1 MerR family transcriptional regulator [Lysinibacillus xylanilyticus]
MDETITINQLAKIFDISHHQIRYYKEKGLLFPSFTDNNRYRKYSLKEIYQLAQILMLRNLNLSIAQIKDMLTSYEKNDYLSLLREKSKELSDEINKLQKIKKAIDYHYVNITNKKVNSIKYLKESHLEKVITLKTQETLSAKDFLKLQLSTQFFYNDIIYVFEEDEYHICIKTEHKTDFIIIEGKYSSIFIIGENDDEFGEQILSIIDKKNAPIYAMELSSGIFTNSNILELEVLIPEKSDI